MDTSPQFDQLDDELKKARIFALRQEGKAYKAERRYHQAQTERLEVAAEEDAASMPEQRIYDFTSEVSFGHVRAAVNTLTEWVAKDNETPITFRILSFGGDLFAGLAMYDALRIFNLNGTRIDTQAIGVVASAGFLIFQGGHERTVSENAWLMIHELSQQNVGKLSELLDETKWAKRAQQQILEICADRSKLSPTQIKNRWNRKDWWLTAEEAVEYGFADRVI